MTVINNSLTLGEAIERLRREEDPDGQTVAAMAGDTAAFDMHDAVHILFGCDTSLEGEIAAHVWMKFGTTAKIGDMHRAVANKEHRRVLAV
jgi:ubiquinone biosynthesis protein Coq4